MRRKTDCILFKKKYNSTFKIYHYIYSIIDTSASYFSYRFMFPLAVFAVIVSPPEPSVPAICFLDMVSRIMRKPLADIAPLTVFNSIPAFISGER